MMIKIVQFFVSLREIFDLELKLTVMRTVAIKVI